MWHDFSIAEVDVDDARDKVLEIARQIEQEKQYPEVASPNQ